MQPLPLSIPCNVYMSRSGYKAALWTCKQSYTQVSPSPSVLHELGINAADSDLYIINKVFLQHKILSLETILSASAPPPPPPHTHTHMHPHTQSLWLYKSKYTQLKTGSKRPGDLEWIQMHGTENMAGLQIWEKKCF